MAEKELVKLIKSQNVQTWNKWRENNLNHIVDLRRADLRGLNLTGFNLSGGKLYRADLRRTNLFTANLSKADLQLADLRRADLTDAKLIEADLKKADLSAATLVDTYVDRAIFLNCRIYGISVWGLRGQPAIQNELVISSPEKDFKGQLDITVDNLKIAQFVHLLLRNPEIREIIDTITTKMVLILGRFTPKRTAILEEIKKLLRENNYVPVIFNFLGPNNRNLTETISTLAHLSRFIIADISDPKSIPQELMAIVPSLPSVPVLPLIESDSQEYGLFESFRSYPWVLPVLCYENFEKDSITIIDEIINVLERKLRDLMPTE